MAAVLYVKWPYLGAAEIIVELPSRGSTKNLYNHTIRLRRNTLWKFGFLVWRGEHVEHRRFVNIIERHD